MAGPLRVAMVAGEASGDQLAAPLIAALKARRPMQFAGIGGPRMAAEGFDSHYPMDKLSVRGYVEALWHFREIMGIRGRLARAMLAERPDLFIGVDASDFNLGLERRLKNAGIPAIHYISPSVWAWRGWRVRKVARCVDHLLVMFPFEAPLYEKAGVPVTYVGHPLADLIPLKPNRDEARVCPMVTRDTRDMFERAVYENQRTDLPLTLLFGHSHEALAAADLALVASGTATLEAALFKTPMVIAYRQAPLSFALMRAMLYLPYVGMPNILAGEKLVPELLQDEATPAALAAALIALLRDTAAQQRQRERFMEFHEQLRRNAAERAADAVLSVIDARRH